MGPRRGILKQSPEARGAAKSSGQQPAHGPPLLVGNEDYEEEDKAMISGLLGRSGYESGGRPPCVDNGDGGSGVSSWAAPSDGIRRDPAAKPNSVFSTEQEESDALVAVPPLLTLTPDVMAAICLRLPLHDICALSSVVRGFLRITG